MFQKLSLLFCLLLLIGKIVLAQTGSYECYIDNIVYPSNNVLEFDILIKNTGNDTKRLYTFQMGLEFDYPGMANGGTITPTYIPGSTSALLPPAYQNLTLNTQLSPTMTGGTYRQIRLVATAIPDSIAITVPTQLTKYVSLRLTNTVPFTTGSTPNFIWSFNNASGRMRTALATYINSGTTPAPITNQNTGGTPNTNLPSNSYSYIAGPQHFITANPPAQGPTGLTVQEASKDLDFSFSPNPANNTIHFQKDAGTRVILFNLSGQMVLSTKEQRLDITSIPKGIYWLRLENQNKGKAISIQ